MLPKMKMTWESLRHTVTTSQQNFRSEDSILTLLSKLHHLPVWNLQMSGEFYIRCPLP